MHELYTIHYFLHFSLLFTLNIQSTKQVLRGSISYSVSIWKLLDISSKYKHANSKYYSPNTAIILVLCNFSLNVHIFQVFSAWKYIEES